MKYCNLYLGPEGGFAHAAAALSKPGVVIYGGWIPPQVIGYAFSRKLVCGHRRLSVWNT